MQSSLVYIACAGHSGSSLLDAILNNHPIISGTGEIHRLTITPATRKCSCGRLVTACPRWQPIIQMYALNTNSSSDTVLSRFPIHQYSGSPNVVKVRHSKVPDIAEITLLLGNRILFQVGNKLSSQIRTYNVSAINSWKLYDAIAGVEQSKLIIDSTKNPVRMQLLRMIRPESVKVIFLIRDGRAIISSAKRRLGKTIAQATKDWVGDNHKLMLMMKSMPASSIYKMRYEQLCDDPQKEIKKLCNFLDIDYFDRIADFSSSTMHLIPGNSMLRDTISKISKDERWKQELSNHDLEEFRSIGGRLNNTLGYS